MKYFKVVTMRTKCADKFEKYSGANDKKAKEVYLGEIDALRKNDPDLTVELRQYDVPNYWDNLDEYGQADHLSTYDLLGDYDIIASEQGIRYTAGC